MPVFVRLAIGDNGGVDAVFLQIKRQVQAAYAGPQNSDFPFHVSLPWIASLLFLVGRRLWRCLTGVYGMDRI
jgi:hypothetical protein